MKRTILGVLFLCNLVLAKAQTYIQTFENIRLTNLVNDSGWISSGLSDYTGGLLGGSYALQTSVLSNPASPTTLTTPYFKGRTNNAISFAHRIQPSNSSNVRLYIYALDSVNRTIKTDSFVYSSSNAQTFTLNFTFSGAFKLYIRWSGSGGATIAYIDDITMSSIYIPNFMPLPAKIMDVKGGSVDKGIRFSWTSLNEENIDRYEILRSCFNEPFTAVGSIYPKPNGALMNSYDFTDETLNMPYGTTVYYRLKTIDTDGSCSESLIVKVVYTDFSHSTVKPVVFPIPATDLINVSNINQTADIMQSLIMDAKGNNMDCSGKIYASANDSWVVDISQLSPGIYYLHTLLNDGSLLALPFIRE